MSANKTRVRERVLSDDTTNMAALGVRIEVTEKLLNHVSGSFGGIVGVYQRHSFQDEMQAAIEVWERRLTHI